MKILYISQYFPPEMGAPAARVAELSRHWARTGHEVTVLTGFPNHPTGVIAQDYRQRFRRMVCRELFDGVNVVRTWLLPLPNRKPLERILNYSSFFLSAGVTGSFLGRPDIVIASSPQLLVGIAGWWIARRHRVPFVFEVRDLWPESLAAVGMGTEASILHRGLRWTADFLYKESERIVVVAPAFKEYLVTRWQLPPDKISVVENGVETALFAPDHPQAALRWQLGCADKFVVSYIGTFGIAHGLGTLIEVAERLMGINPAIVLLLVGEGAERQRLERLVRSRSLPNVIIRGEVPRNTVPAYICASDVCLVPLKKSELFKTVIPTKMLEFMACARPVILGVDGQARQIMEQSGGGICVEPENAKQLVSAILRLAGDAELKRRLGENGRSFIVQHYSRAAKAQSYMNVLDHVVGLHEDTGVETLAAVS